MSNLSYMIALLLFHLYQVLASYYRYVDLVGPIIFNC